MMDKETREALDRIARCADGVILYRYLQQELCSVCHDPSQGALRRHEGRRIFAADLMTQMGEGIASGGRHDDAVILNRRNAEQPKRKLSVRQYVAGLPSWTDDPDPADKSGAA